MSIEALCQCWGPRLPTRDVSARLVAIAIADGVHPEDGNDRVINSPAVLDSIAYRANLADAEVTRALAVLVDIGVLTDFGSYWRWNFS